MLILLPILVLAVFIFEILKQHNIISKHILKRTRRKDAIKKTISIINSLSIVYVACGYIILAWPYLFGAGALLAYGNLVINSVFIVCSSYYHLTDSKKFIMQRQNRKNNHFFVSLSHGFSFAHFIMLLLSGLTIVLFAP